MRFKNISPLIRERSGSGENYFDIATKLASERVIFLDEDVSAESASAITSTLYLLDKQKDDEPIELWINTDGGDTDAFFAIYDMIQLVKSDVKTVCIGKAYSAGALLLSAGTKGQRYCMPNSEVMIHQIQVAGEFSGPGSEVIDNAREIKKVNKKVAEILARHSGQSLGKVLKDIKKDYNMSAKEAIDYGIVDHILGPTKEIPELIKTIKKAKKPEAAE